MVTLLRVLHCGSAIASLVAVLVLLSCTSAASRGAASGEGRVTLLDAGTPHSELLSGWQRLPPDATWSERRGWGWLSTRVKGVEEPLPDDLGRDFVTGASDRPITFRWRRSRGPVRVALLLGDFFPSVRHLPRFYRDAVTVRSGHLVIRSHLAPWKFFRLLSQPYRPGRSLWKTYVAPRYEWLVVEGNDTGDSIDVSLDPWAPICAVVVQEGGKRLALDRLLARVERERAATVRRRWRPTTTQAAYEAAHKAAGAAPADAPLAIHLLSTDETLHPWSGRDWPTAARPHLHLALTPGEWEVFTLGARSAAPAELTIALSSLHHRDRPDVAWNHPHISWGTTWWQERPVDEAPTWEVRHYEVEEGAVLPGARLHLVAGCTGRWWGRLHAPPDAVPGVYEGEVVISRTGGSPVARLPIEVEVYPFRLLRTAAPANVLYYGFRRPGSGYGSIQGSWREGVYRQLHQYGIAPAYISLPHGALHAVEGVGVAVDWSAVDTQIRRRQRFHALPADGRLSLVLLNQASFFHSFWHQPLGGRGSKEIFFSEEPADGRRLQAVVRAALAHARAAGWPEPLFEMGGELQNYRKRHQGLRWGRRVYRLIHEAGGKTLLRANGLADLKVINEGGVDVAMINRRLLRREHIKRIRAAGAELALYNFSRHRFGWGWYASTVGARRVAHEGFAVYYGEPFNDWDGPRLEWGPALPLPEGFAPRPELESIREGIDDAAYLATLDHLLATARDRNGVKVAAAVRRAEALLGRWRDRVVVDVARPDEDRSWYPDGKSRRSPWPVNHRAGWSDADLDTARREVAVAITDLQRALSTGQEKAPAAGSHPNLPARVLSTAGGA